MHLCLVLGVYSVSEIRAQVVKLCKNYRLDG